MADKKEYTLTDEDIKTLNKMRSDLAAATEYIANMKAAGFVPTSGKADGKREIDKLESPQLQKVKITANASGGGKYDGKIVFSSCTSSSGSSNLSLPEGQLISGSTDCLIFNLSENGSSGHALELNTFHFGLVAGIDASNGRKVVLIGGGGGLNAVWVAITSDGGTAGSDGVFPTFTYTFTPPNGSALTTKTPAWRYAAVEHTAGTYGLIMLISGVWTLIITNEQPVMNGCDEEPAFGF